MKRADHWDALVEASQQWALLAETTGRDDDKQVARVLVALIAARADKDPGPLAQLDDAACATGLLMGRAFPKAKKDGYERIARRIEAAIRSRKGHDSGDELYLATLFLIELARVQPEVPLLRRPDLDDKGRIEILVRAMPGPREDAQEAAEAITRAWLRVAGLNKSASANALKHRQDKRRQRSQ